MALLCGKSDVGFRDSRVLICPKSAPIAVSKTDNVKIITPEANQFADAWDIDYRKYHDLFVPENKKAVIAVSLGV
jgi:prophage protein